MPVQSTHPDYDRMLPIWKRARDVVAGQDAIKAATTAYLPKLDGQTDADYNGYRERASFFNATGRTLDGLVGAVMEEPLAVTVPTGTPGEEMTRILNDVDLASITASAYGEKVLGEVIEVARGGTLVEYSEEEKRPYFAYYHAEKIINWRVTRINGVNRLTVVTLMECEDAGDDIFQPDEKPILRVLKLVGGPAPKGVRVQSKDGLFYVVEIWEEKESKAKGSTKAQAKSKEWVLRETLYPMRLGNALPDIPFTFHSPLESCIDVCKLPLDDLIAVNLDHYRLDADYKHGLHFTALPTAWVAGFPKDSTLRIGSQTAWVSDDPNAKAAYLEFTGQGLNAVGDALKRDERIMTVLGARLLEEQKNDAEATQTVELRHKGTNSILSRIASALSKSLTKAVHWLFWWQNAEVEHPDDIEEEKLNVKLSQEFAEKHLTPDDCVKLVSAWQSGGMSDFVFCSAMKEGGAYPSDHTVQEEMELIEAKKQEAMAQEMQLNQAPPTPTPPTKTK